MFSSSQVWFLEIIPQTSHPLFHPVKNASPLVLFLPKIRWSSSDLPRVLPGVDRWILTRWLHPQFVVSQETRLWSSLRSSVVSLDNLPSNCSVNSSRLQVFFASWLPKSPSRLRYLLSLDPYRFTGDKAYALEAALLFKVAVVLAIACYSCISFLKVLWPSGLCHSMFQSYPLSTSPKSATNNT